jgi:hypothetical protein
LYEANGAVIGNLIADSGQAPAVQGWNALPFPSPLRLNPGDYWLAYEYTTDGSVTIHYDNWSTTGTKTIAYTTGAVTFGAFPTSLTGAVTYGTTGSIWSPWPTAQLHRPFPPAPPP